DAHGSHAVPVSRGQAAPPAAGPRRPGALPEHLGSRTAVAAVAVAVVISGSVAAAQAVPVTKYTLRSSLLMRNDGDPSIDSSRWTATIVQAADKRGRMDIVDGFDREFKKGDYVLFDSAGAIVVRP